MQALCLVKDSGSNSSLPSINDPGMSDRYIIPFNQAGLLILPLFQLFLPRGA